MPGSDATTQAALDSTVDRANALMAGRMGNVTVAASEFPGARRGRLPTGTITFLFTDIEGSTEPMR